MSSHSSFTKVHRPHQAGWSLLKWNCKVKGMKANMTRVLRTNSILKQVHPTFLPWSLQNSHVCSLGPHICLACAELQPTPDTASKDTASMRIYPLSEHVPRQWSASNFVWEEFHAYCIRSFSRFGFVYQQIVPHYRAKTQHRSYWQAQVVWDLKKL